MEENMQFFVVINVMMWEPTEVCHWLNNLQFTPYTPDTFYRIQISITNDFVFTGLASNNQYYSMIMINDTIESINIRDSKSCKWNSDGIVYGGCYRSVKNRYNALFLDSFRRWKYRNY